MSGFSVTSDSSLALSLKYSLSLGLGAERSFPAHHRASWAGAGRFAKPMRDHYSWLAPRTFSTLSLAISRKKAIPWELRDEFRMFVTCGPLLFVLA
jgi:hypothetical protein